MIECGRLINNRGLVCVCEAYTEDGLMELMSDKRAPHGAVNKCSTRIKSLIIQLGEKKTRGHREFHNRVFFVMNFPNEMFLFLDSKFELKKFFRFAEEKQKA